MSAAKGMVIHSIVYDGDLPKILLSRPDRQVAEGTGGLLRHYSAWVRNDRAGYAHTRIACANRNPSRRIIVLNGLPDTPGLACIHIRDFNRFPGNNLAFASDFEVQVAALYHMVRSVDDGSDDACNVPSIHQLHVA